MPIRRYPLRTNYVYHVFNRGVAKQTVFHDDLDYLHFIEAIDYYRPRDQKIPLSIYRRNQTPGVKNQGFVETNVEILAFCLMPNHFHLMLRQTSENGISHFLANVTNSYTRSYNTRYSRIGPLFQGPFKAVWVETDEQLIHLSRYIHLNPVVAGLAQKPEAYHWSSYNAYLSKSNEFRTICDPLLILALFTKQDKYQLFINNHLDYARSLETLKHAILD
ncbi:MAG: transposase [Patescibacteria group bacterium]